MQVDISKAWAEMVEEEFKEIVLNAFKEHYGKKLAAIKINVFLEEENANGNT